MIGKRQASKIRTRNKLVRGAIRLLYRSGPAALTTKRVASEAGVAQPTFYVHFDDMNALSQEVAMTISAAILTRVQRLREVVTQEPSRRALRQVCETAVRVLVEDPRYAELYLRHRRDVGSPVGERFGELTKMVRQMLYDELTRIGLRDELPHFEVHFELMFGMTIGLVEAIVDRRVGDLDTAVDVLTDSISTQVRAHRRGRDDAAA